MPSTTTEVRAIHIYFKGEMCGTSICHHFNQQSVALSKSCLNALSDPASVLCSAWVTLMCRNHAPFWS